MPFPFIFAAAHSYEPSFQTPPLVILSEAKNPPSPLRHSERSEESPQYHRTPFPSVIARSVATRQSHIKFSHNAKCFIHRPYARASIYYNMRTFPNGENFVKIALNFPKNRPFLPAFTPLFHAKKIFLKILRKTIDKYIFLYYTIIT